MSPSNPSATCLDISCRAPPRTSSILLATCNTQRALELLALPLDGAPRLLLDIGCGSGLSGEALTNAGHAWLGLDISAAMLDVAAEREVRRLRGCACACVCVCCVKEG
jgi:SAM-dependent methyltransferase